MKRTSFRPRVQRSHNSFYNSFYNYNYSQVIIRGVVKTIYRYICATV